MIPSVTIDVNTNDPYSLLIEFNPHPDYWIYPFDNQEYKLSQFTHLVASYVGAPMNNILIHQISAKIKSMLYSWEYNGEVIFPAKTKEVDENNY